MTRAQVKEFATRCEQSWKSPEKQEVFFQEMREEKAGLAAYQAGRIAKGYVQVLGYWVKPSTKKHLSLLADLKHFESLRAGE